MIVVKRETGQRYPAQTVGEGNDIGRVETWLRAYGVERDVHGIQQGTTLIIDPQAPLGVHVLGPSAFAQDWEIPVPDEEAESGG